MGRGSRGSRLPNMAAGASLSSQSRKSSSTWSSGVQALLLNMDPLIRPMWPVQPVSPLLGTHHTLVLFILLALNLQVTPWLQPHLLLQPQLPLSSHFAQVPTLRAATSLPSALLLRLCLGAS